ncbi:mevalonate kinase [Trichomonascus vanleenenianus]|uniref:mevalonate kinase n=1 Tax=Trichomonascus vanleenenianus TaxID=2268995 RepID=UPI003ECA68CA
MAGNFAVSAPGKIILFGEHSVVHAKPAIAAAVGLRTYLLVSPPEKPGWITLEFPDIKLNKSWPVDKLPFVAKSGKIPDELDEAVVGKINDLLADVENTFQHAAALAFLYLYVSICDEKTEAKSYTAHSLLPVGAGLGSSASISVCVASALLKVSNSFVRDPIEEINAWSFIGEKCIHGNPSGIDNAVATRGGAVYYKKPDVLRPITNFPPLQLVLTNTRVPRRTSELVAGVKELKERIPSVMEPILDAMGSLADEADKTLSSLGGDPVALSAKLAELARINHGLLVSIGVSHPTLEKVKSTSDTLGLGQTKLTGAGGGGCAVTIVTATDDSEATVHEKIERFRAQMPEFEVFETLLGAKGAGFAEVDASISSAKFASFIASDYDRFAWKYW